MEFQAAQRRSGHDVPAYSDFDPIKLDAFKANLVLVDILDGDDFEYRIYGDDIARHLGASLLSRRTSDLPVATARAFTSIYHQVINDRCPYFSRTEASPPVAIAHWDRLLVPLASDGERIDQIAGLDFPCDWQHPSTQLFQLSHALREISQGLGVFDHRERLVVWNRQFTQLLGIPAGSCCLGITLGDLSEKIDTAEHPHTDDELHSPGINALRAPNFELTRAGPRVIQCRSTPTPDGGRVTIVTDVTDARNAEHQLAARVEPRPAPRTNADQVAQTLFDAIERLDEAFALWDVHDNLVFANAKARARSDSTGASWRPGISLEEHLELLARSGVSPSAAGREQAWCAERLAHYQHSADSFEHTYDDGTVVLQRSQKIGGYTVVTTVDVTQLKQIEREAMQTQKYRAVGQLAGGVAHEFNNLLAIILGQATLGVHATTSRDNLNTYFREITHAGDRARQVVSQLLTFLRGDSVEVAILELGQAITETAELLRATLPATIELKVALHDELYVQSNPSQLQQVLLNLCLNAQDAMDNRGVLTLSTQRVEWTGQCTSCGAMREGEYIALTVADTGEGMPSDRLSQAFHPFFTTKGADGGTGMGLSMVHGIAHQHDGHVDMVSSIGEGTTVRLLLPPRNPNSTNLKPEQSMEPPNRERLATAGPRRLAIVDDEPSIVRLLATAFAAHGFDAVTFTEPLEAQKAFLEGLEVDVIITDLTMPHLSGVELAQSLKTHNIETPIILCTGYSNAIDESSAKEQGITAVQYKPVPLDDLIALAIDISNTGEIRA